MERAEAARRLRQRRAECKQAGGHDWLVISYAPLGQRSAAQEVVCYQRCRHCMSATAYRTTREALDAKYAS